MNQHERNKEHEQQIPDCVCTQDRVCATCVEKLKKSGIPQPTLDWMQLDKMRRIETVMF